jgi:hypothetical protein
MYGPYIRVESREAWERACKLAKGRFQRRVVEGHQRLDLADVVSWRSRFGGSYVSSLENLLVRLRKAGILVGEEGDGFGLRRLVIGDPEVCYRLCDHKGYEYVTMRSKNP